MSNLIPTPTIDKNGKQTTVHKKTDVVSSHVASIPAPTLATKKPFVKKYSPAIDAIATQAEALIAEHGSSVVFENANAYRDGEPDTLTLNDMADGENASGNCLSATLAIMRSMYDLIPGDDDPQVINIETTDESWKHTAIASWSDDIGDYVVMDFTARQMNDDIPFPYVAAQNEWKKTIQKYADLGKLQFAENDADY